MVVASSPSVARWHNSFGLNARGDELAPTRVKASNVANAILDGSDAVMLSGETAVGKYPKATQTMARLTDAVEASRQFKACARKFESAAMRVTDVMGDATCEIAEQVGAQLIITATFSGYTARMIARHHPLTRIFAVTANEKDAATTGTDLGHSFRTHCARGDDEEIIAHRLAAAQRKSLVQSGDRIVITGEVSAVLPDERTCFRCAWWGKN